MLTALAAGAAAGIQAALITYSSTETLVLNAASPNPSVLTNGTSVLAMNINGASDAVINNITFKAGNNITSSGVTGLAAYGTGGGSMTVDAAHNNNPDLNQMLSTFIYTTTYSSTTENDAISFDLSGLTVGQQYQVQFFFGQKNAGARHFTIENESNESNVSLEYDNASDTSRYYWVTATWTADNTAQGFDLEATGTDVSDRALLNGVSLLAIPEPAALGLLGMAFVGLLGARRLFS